MSCFGFAFGCSRLSQGYQQLLFCFAFGPLSIYMLSFLSFSLLLSIVALSVSIVALFPSVFNGISLFFLRPTPLRTGHLHGWLHGSFMAGSVAKNDKPLNEHWVFDGFVGFWLVLWRFFIGTRPHPKSTKPIPVEPKLNIYQPSRTLFNITILSSTCKNQSNSNAATQI